jgi:hypothetical protein
MDRLILTAGRVAGLLGIAVIAFAAIARLAGHYTIGDFQAVTLLVAGMGGVMVGCFGLLWSLAERR